MIFIIELVLFWGAVKNEQLELWSGHVPTDPTTSAGHGFGGGTSPVPPIWIHG